MSHINICKTCGKPFYAANTGDSRCADCVERYAQADRDMAELKREIRERGKVI